MNQSQSAESVPCSKHQAFVDALISKGYTPYLAHMLEKMLSDLESHAAELSSLSSIKFSVEVSL